MKELKDKEKLFVSYYITHFNASKAVKQCGIETKAYSQTARALLNKREVREEIKRQLSPTLEQNDINKNELIKFCSDILRDIRTEKLPFKLKNRDGSELVKHEKCEIQIKDKLKAVDTLCKIMKIYEESSTKPNIVIQCTVPKPELLDDN